MFIHCRQEKTDGRTDEHKRKSIESLPQSKNLRRSIHVRGGNNEDDDVMSANNSIVSSVPEPDDSSPPFCNSPASRQSSRDSTELLASTSSGGAKRNSSTTDGSSISSSGLGGDRSPIYHRAVLERRRETSSADRELLDVGRQTAGCDKFAKREHCSVDSLLTELERLTEKSSTAEKGVADRNSPLVGDDARVDNDDDCSARLAATLPLRDSHPTGSSPRNEDRGAESDYENIADEAPVAEAAVETTPSREASSVADGGSGRTPNAGVVGDDVKTTDDLSVDIDTALAEVMSGIELLRRERRAMSSPQQLQAMRASAVVSTHEIRSPALLLSAMRDFKPTPDLVVGLPYGSRPTSASSKADPAPAAAAANPATSNVGGDVVSPTSALTTAEVFANVDRCTIKKASVPISGTVSAPPSAGIMASSENPLRSAVDSSITVPESRLTSSIARTSTVIGSRDWTAIERRPPHQATRVGSFYADGNCSSFRTPSADNSPVRTSSCRVQITTDRRLGDHHSFHPQQQQQQQGTWTMFSSTGENQATVMRRPESELIRTVVGTSFDFGSGSRSTDVAAIVSPAIQRRSAGGQPNRLMPATGDDGVFGERKDSSLVGQSPFSAQETTSGFASTTLPRSSPERRATDSGVGGAKPPVKAKPQVVKKPAPMPPAEASELWRRLNELQAAASGVVVGDVAPPLSPK